MDIKKLTQEVLLKNMTQEQQLAVLESVTASVKEAKAVQKQKIAENVDLVLQALKRIEADMLKRVEDSAQVVESRVKTIKDGKDGKNGLDGKNGKDGINGKDGKDGRDGRDGLNGKAGERGQDGVGVQNAHIDFDGSLIISLTNGQELNVGEVVPFDVAEKIRVIGNGGGTSQYVLDTLASLQTQINAVSAGLIYKGTWNASTNTPSLTSGSGTNGWYYVVSVAGSTNLNGVTDWQVGDWAIFNGTVWQKIDQTNLVTSVAGRTGDITLTYSDIGGTVPTWNQNTTGTAANVSGTVAVSNGGTGATTASTARTNLGATTLGGNLFTVANPSAITFPRFNADNTVSTLDAATFRTAIGAGAGTVTSVAATAGTGISISGSPITSSGTLTITNTAPDQTVVLTGAGTTTVTGTYPNFTITSADSATGTVTSVTGTSPVVSSGGNTPAISLAAGYGDTQNPYASKTANYFLAAPNGSSGAPTFRAIVAADIPTLNQNTTGSAATVTTTINSGVTATTQTAGDNSTKVATTAYVNAVTGTSGINGFKNRIINGAMMIDQRNAGASVTPASGAFVYNVDRWGTYQTQASKITVQQNAGSVTPPAGFSNYVGITSSSAYSVISTDQFLFEQAVEANNVFDLSYGTANAQTVTVSFWVRSSLTGTFAGCLRNYAGTRSYPFTYSISSANTWQQVSITVAGDTSGTWVTSGSGGSMYVIFNLGSGTTFLGTAGAWATGNYTSVSGSVNIVGTSGATFYITGVQLEKGSTATSFDYRPYGTELALCQRYYEQLSSTGGFNALGGAGVFTTTTQFRAYVTYQTKRVMPTFTSSAASTFVCIGAPGNLAASAISLGSTNYSAAWVTYTVAGATAGQGGFTADNNSSGAYLAFSAEL